jgi:hypothetical protein
VRGKAEKHYRPQPHLLVYVNVPLFTDLPLTDQQAIGLAEPGRDQFASIWLLWGGNAVCCFPNPAKIVLRDLPLGLFGLPEAHATRAASYSHRRRGVK